MENEKVRSIPHSVIAPLAVSSECFSFHIGLLCIWNFLKNNNLVGGSIRWTDDHHDALIMWTNDMIVCPHVCGHVHVLLEY